MKKDEIGKAARVSALASAAGAIGRAVRDDGARTAMRGTYDRGRHLYGQLESKGWGEALSRLARDERLQRELGAVVRSATRTVERGIAANRRRRRRRMMAWIAVIGGIGAVAATRLSKRRARTTPVAYAGDGHEPSRQHAAAVGS